MDKHPSKCDITQQNINYQELVDGLSDEAFSFCVLHTHPLYNYRVLQPEDIRRIDLKENLSRIKSKIPYEQNNMGTLGYYLYMMKLQLEYALPCEPNSRAERYKARGLNAIESALSGEGTLLDVDDAFLMFMCLLRTLRNQMDKKNLNIVHPFFGVKITDVDILKEFEGSHRFVFEETQPKKKTFWERSKKVNEMVENQIKKAKFFLYINHILFLARALQNEGAFAVEEA